MVEKKLLPDIKIAYEKIRGQKPLVLNLTNFVTMDFMANVLLAIGAAPFSCNSLPDEEMTEIITIASAVNINIGSLDNPFTPRAVASAHLAKKLQKPLVLDPVGAGASQLRTKVALELFPMMDIIRGNGSEVISLAGETGKSLGVESTVKSSDASTKTIADKLAGQDKIIIVSGEADYMTDGKNNFTTKFGSPLMALVTGMGCALTAVVAAFAAVEKKYLLAAYLATSFFALTGQVAAYDSPSLGSFKTKFVDMLYAPDWQKIEDAINAT